MIIINRLSYWLIREQSVCRFAENISDAYSSAPRKWITVKDFMNMGRLDQQDYAQFFSICCTYIIYKEACQAIREICTLLGRIVCEKNLSYSFM